MATNTPIQQPVVVQTNPVQGQQVSTEAPVAHNEELVVYSHSRLLYWWPAWAVGYLCALFTYLDGRPYQIGDIPTLFHPDSSVGVIYFVTLFLTILITTVTVRGLASVVVIMAVAFTTVLFAYLEWWDDILNWMGHLRIYLNLGTYVAFSTLLFVVWALTVFVFDRMSYWRIKPGQITHEFILGAAARSYDTENMVLEKYRDDVFRHWVLGLGSGDLLLKPYGADREQIHVPNVLFVGAKVARIQKMIATEPGAFGHVVLK